MLDRLIGMSIRVRPATLEDASEIARLSGQLGYPVTPQEIAERLQMLQEESHATLVADTGSGLSGWIAAEKGITLESGVRYEIVGLVVDASARRTGTGRVLVRSVCNWAASKGAASIRVRSNIARQESHVFYQAMGFERSKSQHVYALALPAVEESRT